MSIGKLSTGNFNLKEPIENGLTFEDNSLIKSSFVCKNTGIPSLSDDSGICFSDLNNELKILGKKGIKNQIIDTLILARDKFPGSPSNLDALCKRYRIDNSRRTKHTALVDCDLLAKVYINLIDQKEPTLNFSYQEKINYQDGNKKINYFKKIIKPSEDELKRHTIYLKSQIKKNFFN